MVAWTAEIIGLLVGSLVSIGAYTLLIGDNPISRITENLYTGILAGYIVATNWDYIARNAITRVGDGNYIYIIPIVLSLMLVARLNPTWLWLYRYPVALTVGAGLGLAIRTTIVADFLGQIKATVLPLTSFNNIVMIVGTITAVAYFLWSTRFEGTYVYVNRVGRLFLLIAFGVSYGQTVSFRFELVIGRLVAMLDPRIAMYTYAFIALVAIVLVVGYKTGMIRWYSGR
jgi:hypothetical protein